MPKPKNERSRAVKNEGRIYTPKFIVSEMLDFAGYTAGNISKKHVIDNSCGDGAFLVEIARLYCEDFFARHGDLSARERYAPEREILVLEETQALPFTGTHGAANRKRILQNTLKTELETFIHGIEINAEEASKCRKNLSWTVRRFGIENVNWDIRTADALSVSDFDGRMDFVFGNPPYVRIHNLAENSRLVRDFSFARSGMTDLFIVFFEISFRMLAGTGSACLITPSSWLTSQAGTHLCEYVSRRKTLTGVIDLGHFQAFEAATTYSLVSRFSNAQQASSVEYNVFVPVSRSRRFVENLHYSDFTVGNGFFFSPCSDLALFRAVRESNVGNFVQVKNGFATLADRVFVGTFPFTAGTIPVVKASRGEWKRCIFPYSPEGKTALGKHFSGNCSGRLRGSRRAQRFAGKRA